MGSIFSSSLTIWVASLRIRQGRCTTSPPTVGLIDAMRLCYEACTALPPRCLRRRLGAARVTLKMSSHASDRRSLASMPQSVQKSDLNGDGQVNHADKSAMISAFGPVPPGAVVAADLNNDGVVNRCDLLQVYAN